MKKKLCAALAFVFIISMIICIGIQNRIINSYENGFDPVGTFEYIDYETDDLNKQHYIVLEEMQDNIICYSYKQYGDLEKNAYEMTEIPNLLFEKSNSPNNRMIWLGKDCLYYINETNIVQYNKISDIGVFLNTGAK